VIIRDYYYRVLHERPKSERRLDDGVKDYQRCSTSVPSDMHTSMSSLGDCWFMFRFSFVYVVLF